MDLSATDSQMCEKSCPNCTVLCPFVITQTRRVTRGVANAVWLNAKPLLARHPFQ